MNVSQMSSLVYELSVPYGVSARIKLFYSGLPLIP